MAINGEEFKPRAMVHVRIIKAGDLYAAQCLEYDIAAQGTDVLAALQAWQKAVERQVGLDKQRGREPLSTFPCAPMFLWCDIKRDEIVGIYIEGVKGRQKDAER